MKTLLLKTHNNVNIQNKLLADFLNIPGVEVSFEAQDEDESPDNQMFTESALKYVQREYNNGNAFAWFCAKVIVRYKGFEADDYLGCCSYKSEKDFKENSGYYIDMIQQCVVQINTEIEQNNASTCKRFQIRQLKNSAEKLGFYLIPKTAIV